MIHRELPIQAILKQTHACPLPMAVPGGGELNENYFLKRKNSKDFLRKWSKKKEKFFEICFSVRRRPLKGSAPLVGKSWRGDGPDAIDQYTSYLPEFFSTFAASCAKVVR